MTTRPPPPKIVPERSRGRRVLVFSGRVLAAISLGAVFSAGLVGGVVLHVNLPASRRVAARIVARELTGTFYGSVNVGEISELGTHGATVTDLTVLDEAGNTVLALNDVRIRTDVMALFQEALSSKEKLTFAIRQVRAERAEVQVDPDPVTGVPTIARALTPVPSTKKPSTAPTKAARQVRFWLPAIDVAHVYARGRVASLPTLEVTLGGVKGSVLVTQKGVAIDVSRYGVAVRGLGGADATGTGDLHIRAPGAVWSSFDGYFGNVPLEASIYVKGKKLTTSLDVPKGKPEDVRALWPEWPLQQAVAAHLEATGELPLLQANARFEIEGARLTANGPIRVGPDLSVNLDVEGRDVNLRALWPTAPKTSVDVDAAVAVLARGQRVTVDVNGTTGATTIVGQSVPAIDVTGTFDEKGFGGKATLHERGIPLKMDFTVHPDGALDMDAQARAVELQDAPRVAAYTKAKGRADVRVKARIAKNAVDANLVGDISGFELGEVKLSRGHVTGHARGLLSALDKLDIDAKVTGSDLAAKGMSFGKVSATADGPVTRPRVSAKLTDNYGPEVNARAVLETGKKPSVKDLSVEVKREGATLGGKIARLDLDTQEVVIDDLKLSGTGGDVAGAMRIGKGKVELKAKGDGLDLDALSRALGLPRGLVGGKLNIDADVVASKKESFGHVRIGLGNGSIASVSGISLSVDANLDGEGVKGEASAQVQDVGVFGTKFDAQLAGNPALLSSWKGVTGGAEIQASEVDLSLLSRILPKALRVEKVAGTGFARVRIERLGERELPNLRVELAGTRGLEVTRSPADKGGEPEEWKGVELQVVGGLSGEKGDASGTTQIYDQGGALVTTSGTVRVDFHKLIAEPDDWLSQLSEAPTMVVVMLHERPFSQLPPPIRPSGLAGSLGGRVTLSGSLNEPIVSANLDAHGLGASSSRQAAPVDAHATAQYEIATGRFGGSVELMRGKRRIARLSSLGVANLGDGSWTGGASLALENAPLSVIPGLADARVAGSLNGAVVLQRTKATDPPALSANIDVTRASVDQVPVGEGNLVLRSDGRQVRAQLSLANESGKLDADGRAGLEWAGVVPELDRSRPVKVAIQADAFDAAVLTPFVRDIFSRLTGKVDGKVDVTLEAKLDSEGKPTSNWKTKIEGDAKVREGNLQIAPLGLEISDVSFQAQARESGNRTAIEIRNVEGKARSETPNVKGQANVELEGLRVVRGNGSLSMTDLPLLLEGVPQGTANGNATLQLERQGDLMLVTTEVPNLSVKLPQAQSRSVVALGDNPAIDVAQPLREPKAPSTGTIVPWRFVVNLSHGVRIKRSDLDIPITGQPVVDLTPKAAVSGYVELDPGGRFQAWGKTFVVDTGRVLFDTGDPTNPHVSATASWRGPDGTIVTVELRGTLKDAKISISSDPPRTEPEIMALLFGGASDAGSEDTSSARTRESAAAGGIATAFNTLFADALVGAVELRTATNENKASYTAAVRISESVWFEGTYSNRLEATQDTTSTEPMDVSGTVDWRFRRNWSLRTEVGTLGTGLDVLWQYRY